MNTENTVDLAVETEKPNGADVDGSVDKVVAAQIAAADDVDVKEYYKLIFPEHDIKSIGDAMELENTEIGSEEFQRQLAKIGSYPEVLKRMLDAWTDQTLYIAETLKRITNPAMVGDSYEAPPKDDIPDSKGFSLKNQVISMDKSLNGLEVGGYQARMLILAGNRNIKKVQLYNSGFHIILKGPSLVEINLVYNRLAEDMGEYGRMMGAIFYMYSDFKIKEIIWEFIRPLIIGSNLNKWDKGNRLRDNISLLDYQLIVLSLGSLMFKNGYDFVHVCTNPTCRKQSVETIDLNLLQLTDFSRIPYEQLSVLAAGAAVTPDDVRAYKKGLGINSDFTIGRYKIYRSVPTMSSYITNGSAFNEELSMSIHDIKKPEVIDQYLKYNYSRLFEPWISMIEVLNDDGTVNFKTFEKESIAVVLDELQNSGDREVFTEKMDEFIQAASITNIGYLAKPCDACNIEPSGAVNGFVPFDAQNSFFTMLVMRLIQTS